MYCPYCGATKVSQLTKRIIVMQLPGRAVECACFCCDSCTSRWFVERDSCLGPKEVADYCPARH